MELKLHALKAQVAAEKPSILHTSASLYDILKGRDVITIEDFEK